MITLRTQSEINDDFNTKINTQKFIITNIQAEDEIDSAEIGTIYYTLDGTLKIKLS